MSKTFSRTDTSLLGRWWWTVDRWTLAALIILLSVGFLLSFAGSPPVAHRLKLEEFYFVKRHIFLLIPSLVLIIGVSLLNVQQIRRLSVFLYGIGILCMIVTVFYGVEIKGARRWLSIGGLSIQASEFVKPAFCVLVAWMFAEKAKSPDFPGVTTSLLLMFVFIGFLLLQPDLGMTLVAVATWVGILFIAGIQIFWIILAGGVGAFVLGVSYLIFPHVHKRLDQFLNPQNLDAHQDLYQINQSLEAFANGGFFGRGPGEGIVKKHLPDAHADFIFAVAGEEFGLWLCFFLLGLFLFIILRSFIRAISDNNVFAIFSIGGLLIQFGLQAVINMASSLHMIPTKGMTMPFISYGGSSMLALSMAMGMVLALTRKRHGRIGP